MQQHVGWKRGSRGRQGQDHDVRVAGLEPQRLVEVQSGSSPVVAREFEGSELKPVCLYDQSLHEPLAVSATAIALRDDDVVDVAARAAEEAHDHERRHAHDAVRLRVATDHETMPGGHLPDVVHRDGRGFGRERLVESGDIRRIVGVEALAGLQDGGLKRCGAGRFHQCSSPVEVQGGSSVANLKIRDQA